ncbi:MAG: FAD-dependent oxidoreductase [Dehalococcoidia bacterium]
MANPVILTVDDEPQVRNAIERDLRRQYGAEYRIIKAATGGEALETVRQLKQRNDPVALFLVDQRMPGMSGIEFLAEALKLYPEARKVLLTAYADTGAAIDGINSIGLDYFLMKPWNPPDRNLYPVLDDLLSDWLATARMPYDGIRVAGALWSSRSHDVKDFLARNRIPYKWLDIEKDPVARELIKTADPDHNRLPVVFFPDGEVLVEPDNRSIAEKVGLTTRASEPFYDLIIVGGGPSGLAAAVYAAAGGARTALIEREATGGQAGTSARIENYLGFPNGVSGSDLARRATIQAQRFGVEILIAQEVCGIRVDGQYRVVTLGDRSELSCHSLLIATGVSLRQLDVPGIQAVTGAGIYYGAAVTEATNYRGQEVFVVGGANAAGQGAMFFSRYASKVTMLIRGRSLEESMAKYLRDRIEDTENIEVLPGTELIEVKGTERLEGIKVRSGEAGLTQWIPAVVMYVCIGAKPHTDLVDGVLELDQGGFILTGQDLVRDGKGPTGWSLERDPFPLETNVPGIFAAGDVRHNAIRRVGSAVGEGAMAASLIDDYLKTV